MKNIDDKKLLIITPVFNDWESFELLTKDIDILVANKYNVSILAINDGSKNKFNINKKYTNIHSLKVINLIRNIGHQRAIAVGLSSVNKDDYSFIVVMDSDGEDKVNDITNLIELHKKSGQVVVSQRKQRSESIFFKVFYYLYKFIFKILTGRKINFGNFSLISPKVLVKIINLPELWNNYPATILKLNPQIVYFESSRGKRYCGSSKMNFMSLLSHGLSATSVFLDSILIRLLIIFSLTLMSLMATLGLNILFNLTFISTWIVQIIIISIIFLLPIVIILLSTLLIHLNGRSNIIKPIRFSYKDYIKDTDSI